VSDALKAGWTKTATWSPLNATRRSCKCPRTNVPCQC
jgi:hypothetical protein